MLAIYKFSQQARVFVLGRSSELSLMFVGRVWSIPSSRSPTKPKSSLAGEASQKNDPSIAPNKSLYTCTHNLEFDKLGCNKQLLLINSKAFLFKKVVKAFHLIKSKSSVKNNFQH